MKKKPYIHFYLLFITCMFSLCRPKQTVYFSFPTEMLEPVKIEYAKICERGRILYQLNCAGCHSKKIKGNEIIPDFSSEQLEAYSIRVANPQHENPVSESKVTAEELSFILTYLTYKTKNNAAQKTGSKK